MAYLGNIKKIHFVGIGGVGVSAIARMAQLQGIKVTGSDITTGPMTERIKDQGAKIFIGHNQINLPEDAGFVVYSPAVKQNNPELVRARELDIPTYSYPETLGLISKSMYTMAVSGAHGKTTTTSMIAEIMIYTNQAPTIVVGGLLEKQKDNFVLGESKYFIVEACEYKESFLALDPAILVITNIDSDHLDYYGNIENIQNAFAKLISKTKDFVVCNPNEENTQAAIKKAGEIKAQIVDYTKEEIDFNLLVFGKHNIQNAKAALTAVKLLGIEKEKIKKVLKQYSGTWRRFEYKGETKNGSLVYDDYAHHPKEIEATIDGAKQKFPDKKLIIVFQPHLYSRTKFFLRDFGKALKQVDKIIITDIYAAREEDDKSIHAKDLAREIKKYNKNVLYFSKFSDIVKYLEKEKDNSVIITVGAGDIYKVGERLIKI